MGRFTFFALIFLILICTSTLAAFEAEGEALEEKNETIRQVTKTIKDYLGFLDFFKIRGAQATSTDIFGSKFFSVEFIAAFILIYFFVGSASQFTSSGAPRILITMILLGMIWNFLGGMRWERLLILLVPTLIVYYVVWNSLENFAMIQYGTARLIAIAATAITFFFYAPGFVSYMNGQYNYGLLDTLAGAGGIFFAVVIFGFISSKFMMSMSAPMNQKDPAKMRENFYKAVENMREGTPEEKKRKADIKNIIQKFKLLGGGP